MHYTVKLFPRDDGGATVHTPTDYIGLDAAELSQLRSLLHEPWDMPSYLDPSHPDDVLEAARHLVQRAALLRGTSFPSDTEIVVTEPASPAGVYRHGLAFSCAEYQGRPHVLLSLSGYPPLLLDRDDAEFVAMLLALAIAGTPL